MSSQGPLPYLRVGDVELANAARTLEYLRNGLGGTDGIWVLGTGDLCSVLYRLNGGDCVTPDVFVSPTADPAPWYDADEPGSATFLGLVMLGFTGYDSTLTRVVAERIQGLGGGTFSGQRRVPRVWKFRAAMVSGDDAGAEYGLRWLTSVLEASLCDTCETTNLTVRLVCPPADCFDDTQGEWLSYDVALTDGPREVDQWAPRPSTFDDTMAGCRVIVTVEWTMTAGNPYLYKPAEDCLAAEVVGNFDDCTDFCDFFFGDAGDAHCCQVATPTRGTVAPIYTFESVSGMGSLLLGAYPTCPVGSDETTVELEMVIESVPEGGTVVVDCARRTITVTTIDPDTGNLVEADGQYLIDLSDGRSLQWPEAEWCSDVTCFCARTQYPSSQGGDTTVAISTQYREG